MMRRDDAPPMVQNGPALVHHCFKPRLLADAASPFVRASRRVPGLPCLSTFESTRVHVVSPSEERAKQRNLRFRGRVLGDDELERFHGLEAVPDLMILPSSGDQDPVLLPRSTRYAKRAD
jgi:hypothetical protein